MKTKKTFKERLHKAAQDPRQVMVKALQGLIDQLRGYSYNFEKNGERRLLERLAELQPATVFDVGANVGDWSLVASALMPRATIHCFELSPRTYVTLRQRLHGAQFKVNNCGMGHQNSVIEFKDYGENSTVNTILQDATYHDHKIAAQITQSHIVTGDSYCQEQGVDHIDLLKIDVEGADHLVLEGFAQMLGQGAVRVVQFEYGYTHGDAKFLMRDFYRLFASYGYLVGRLSPRGVDFAPWHYKLNDFRSGPNYVAVRQDDHVLLQRLSRF
ncbi:MAG: FkbM family methyltransferase [Serpentinimonas sp.]|jgi:FkbM family methyltransferase|nr:FkbM family methyltransferase [Serpentinimonas sp.]